MANNIITKPNRLINLFDLFLALIAFAASVLSFLSTDMSGDFADLSQTMLILIIVRMEARRPDHCVTGCSMNNCPCRSTKK